MAAKGFSVMRRNLIVGAAHGREQETAFLGGLLVPERLVLGFKALWSKNHCALEPVKTPEGRLSVRGHGPLQHFLQRLV